MVKISKLAISVVYDICHGRVRYYLVWNRFLYRKQYQNICNIFLHHYV